VGETLETRRVLRQDGVKMVLLSLEEIVKVPSDSIDGQNAWHVSIGDSASDVLVHSNDGDLSTTTGREVERIQQTSLSSPAFHNGQILTVRWVDLPYNLDLSVDIDRDVFDWGDTNIRHDVDGVGRPHVIGQAQFSHEMLKIGDQKQGVGYSVLFLVLLRIAAYTNGTSDMGDGGFDSRTLESSVDGKGEEL
jgi:hypothetical protein